MHIRDLVLALEAGLTNRNWRVFLAIGTTTIFNNISDIKVCQEIVMMNVIDDDWLHFEPVALLCGDSVLN